MIQNIGTNGYRINPALYTCDVWRFRNLLAQAATADGQEKTAALMAAVGRYAGPYLKDISHGWARTAARTVSREVVQALAELADLETAPARAVLHLERATDIDTHGGAPLPAAHADVRRPRPGRGGSPGPGGRIDFQTAPGYTPPSWPDPASSMQMHLDFDVDEADAAEARVLAAGATKYDIQPNDHCRVYADPAGHPFCLSTEDTPGPRYGSGSETPSRDLQNRA